MRLAATLSLLLLAACVRADVAPVHVRIRLAGAREAPPTLSDLLFMAARPAKREWTLDVDYPGGVTNGQQGVRWYAGGWQRPIYLFEYSGLINIPAGGEYVFYVRRPFFGPAYLLVNGEPLVDFPNRGARFRRRHGGHGGRPGAEPATSQLPEEWLEGGPIHLEKGPAEYRALGFCEQRAFLSLRWKAPGQTAPQPIPATLLARAGKLRFAGVDRPLVYEAADARLAGVPPFCFPEDALHPEIHVRSDLTNLEVAVEMRFRPGGGEPVAVTSSVAVVRGWGRLALPERRAEACAAIAWRVRAHGRLLAEGAARFVHPPFAAPPARAFGDALVADGTNVVYVSRHFGRMTTPAPLRADPGADAVLLDGFGGVASNLLAAALARVFEGPPPAVSRILSVRDLVGADEALFAPPDVAAVANVDRALPPGLVVLAPEIRGRAQGEGLAAFERRLAAVAGLLSEAAGRKLVLVTPPPDYEAPGGAADMRAYAAAIHRVADAYGLHVADVYTVARCGMRNAEWRMQNGRPMAKEGGK